MIKLGAIENVKEIVNLIQKVGDMELYRKILDLQAEIQKLNEDLLTKEKTLFEKEKIISDLNDKLEFKKS